VQDWQKLSNFLVRLDTLRFPKDTLTAWIQRQEKHVVSGFPRLPLYIRYFTVEAKEGKLKFYDDVYGDDRLLNQRFFGSKAIS
jgi:murein L,D-transpeptidase YcbB/YkuD